MLLLILLLFILSPLFALYTRQKMKQRDLLDKYYYHNGYCSIAAGLCGLTALASFRSDFFAIYLLFPTLGLFLFTFLIVNIDLLKTAAKESTFPYNKSLLYKLGKYNLAVFVLALLFLLNFLNSVTNYYGHGNIDSKNTGDTFSNIP